MKYKLRKSFVRNDSIGEQSKISPIHSDVGSLCCIISDSNCAQAIDYNMVGVAVAMVISTMHEKSCLDSHNAWKIE